MDMNLAGSILYDPDGFWPLSFHTEARKFVEQNGTPEQKNNLGKETIVKGGNGKRLTGENNFGNKRMGAIV